MKQVIIELEDAAHEALKQRAAAAFRKIPQQLLFEALQAAEKINGTPAPVRKAKPRRKAQPRKVA